MTPRAAAPANGEVGAPALVASKCDLCVSYEGPECVSACPTGAIFRVDPQRELLEVRSLLGAPGRAARAPVRRSPVPSLLALGALPPAFALAAYTAALDGYAIRFGTGALAGLACVLLALHSLVKRRRGARALARRRFPRLFARRGLEPLVTFHALTGAASMLLVLSHAGFSVPRGTAGALALAFWLVAASGGFGAALYRFVPSRLTRLERRGRLPEDRPLEREELGQTLFDQVSARNEAVKVLARRVLVPYARSPLGALRLAFSGRSLAGEEAALTRSIEHLLGGRRSARLAEREKLVSVAVALRALRSRALLEAVLGAWVPLHAAGVVLLLGLLVLHVVGVVR
jgi:hypothetical protein